jgi:hypothetical protein
MPEFYVDDLEIEPYEFVRACSKSEIREPIIELVEEEHLPKSALQQMNTNKGNKRNTSILEEEFLEKMDKLSKRFHSISKEDEEILEIIFKKYI